MSTQDVEVLPAVQKTPKRRKNTKLTAEETKAILNLHIAGNDEKEIATIVGRHIITVKSCINIHESMLEQVKDVEQYENLRTKLFSTAELQALRSMMDTAKHDKASLGQVSTAFRTLHSARRLEDNLSTANINNKHKYIDLDEDI